MPKKIWQAENQKDEKSKGRKSLRRSTKRPKKGDRDDWPNF
jgi:hypothetical protein